MTSRAGQGLEDSRAQVEELKQEVVKIEQELKDQTQEISLKWANMLDDITTEQLAPKRTDIDIQLVALAWLPSWFIRYDDGLHTTTATIAAYQLPATG